MALRRSCVCFRQPPWNLSGEWEIGENGELVKLRHWRFVGAIWSTLHQPTPGSETFTGVTFEFEGDWLLRAAYGTEEFQVGSVQETSEGTVIEWKNGAKWLRTREGGRLPHRRSFISTPGQVFKSSTCCQIWTSWILCFLVLWPALIYYFPWQCAAVLLVTFILQVMFPRLLLTGTHCKAVSYLVFFITCISILGHWWSHLPSTKDGYRALGNLLILGLTIQLTTWMDFAWKFQLSAVYAFAWDMFAVGVHLIVRVVLLFSLCFILWPRSMIIPYMCALLFFGMGAAVHGTLAAKREKMVLAEDPAQWEFVKPVDSGIEQRVKQKFQEDSEQAPNMYPFSIKVERVHAIENPSLNFGIVNGNVRSLYHGTSSSGAKGITSQGFELPVLPGMFGRGIYFADVPVKCWQYSAKAFSKYLIVCDVALGRPMMQARGAYLLTRRFLISRGGYDSVVGLSRREGGELRLPEYVVYQEDQIVPRYLLEISQVRDSPLSSTSSQFTAPLLA